jgi:hypothetical protein
VLSIAQAGVPFSQASAHTVMAPVSGIGNSPATAAEVTAGEALTTAYITSGTYPTPIVLTTGIDAPTITGNNNLVLGSFDNGGLTTYTPGALLSRTADLRVARLAALSSAISFKAESSSAHVPMLSRSAYTIH